MIARRDTTYLAIWGQYCSAERGANRRINDGVWWYAHLVFDTRVIVPVHRVRDRICEVLGG